MKNSFQIDDNIYNDMLKMLNGLHFQERIGAKKDMDFIKDDTWLADTAVIENLWRRRGTWEIHLLFVHYRQPLTFLSRSITQHTCPKRAAVMAAFMRRLAAKDQRGTLQISAENFNFPKN
jgi:hypothetical protein